MKIDTTRPRLKLPVGLPKEVIWAVFRLVVGDGWTTDQIRLACGVVDQMDADKRKRGDRGAGPHHSADSDAVQVMLAHYIRTGVKSPRALAKEARDQGYGGRGNSENADIQRMAAALRRSLWFQGLKNK